MMFEPAGKQHSRPNPNRALMHSLMLSAGVLFTALYAILILFLLAMTAH